MAKLFLSYSRKDNAKALRLCEWLEDEGHRVWRDDNDIGGGASFSAEIENALKDCDAVVVLWSASSVQSAWVRDEAGVGRDAGKLIPLTIDGTEPPLGFRQYQAIDLAKWKGHGPPAAREKIVAAIERMTGRQSPPNRDHSASARRSSFPLRLVVGGIVLLFAVAAIGFLLWERLATDKAITIAVVPSPTSSDRAMAVDYANVTAADLSAVLPRRFDRVTVIAPADAGGLKSGYRMLISTDPRGAGANATLTLSDADGHTTLWSENWSVPDASAADLKAQISATASKAALCLTDARGGTTRLSQPALGLYLSGCAGVGDTRRSDSDFETIFERVTKLSPTFGPGWDYLALTRSWIAESLRDRSPAAYAAASRSARDAIAVARKLNPDSAMTYDAEFHLSSNDTFRALQVLGEGAKIDPDDPRIQVHLSDELLSVGRTSDSVQAARRAIEIAPNEPYGRSQYISALVYAGEFSKAKADIAEARKRWPSDPAIDSAEYAFQFRYGDPRAALALLPRLGDSSDADLAPSRKLIAARLDPTRSNIDNAIAALRSRPGNNRRNENDVLLALGNFGRVDEAYQLMEDPNFRQSLDPAILFRPDFAAIRADPRFMGIAAALGLVRYWRKTDYWPDFCGKEQLKYDCKQEAAKYPG